MALKIRLQRQGRAHHPSYKIVIAESSCRRDGRYVEKIGVYETQAQGNAPELLIDIDRAAYWISVGAKATDTVARLICKAKKSLTRK
ncbi:MAG: 30S ribosomal protein S16 [Puniceicoccales bacterium]|jgi:small subunit ribosomal protein S16|nr:30S ribosomal protein S16 [Puniceicoccales bacterium]